MSVCEKSSKELLDTYIFPPSLPIERGDDTNTALVHTVAKGERPTW